MPRPPKRSDASTRPFRSKKEAEPAPARPQKAAKPAVAPAAQSARGAAIAGLRGEAMLYGPHAVAAAWTNPERTCRRLLLTESGAEAMADALAAARAAGLDRPAPVRVERADLDRLLAGAVHQGVALDAEPLPELDIDDALRMAEGAASACLVLLDQVTDPHNVGAILRSASAFGALAVVVTERHAPEVTGVMAKSASGALETVPLIRVVNLARTIETLREGGFLCVGLAESGERTLAEHPLSGRTALVLGAEGPGLRRLTRERCDSLARLPTQGAVGSLNVSNAAAVSLYEVVRQRAAG